MQLRIPRFLLLLLLMALVLSSAVRAEDWATYTADDGSFTISLPKAPEKTGDTDGFRLAASVSDDLYYQVDCKFLGQPMEADAAKAFLAAKDALAQSGKVLAATPIEVAGHPGQDLHILTNDGFTAWDRMIIVNDRLYQMICVTTAEAEAPARFWDSFTLAP